MDGERARGSRGVQPLTGAVVAVAAVVLLALVALTVRAVLDTGDSGDGALSASSGGGASGGAGVVPTPGLGSRFGPTVVWTGSRLFVYGGLNRGRSHFLDDAALVDVRTGDVDALPNPPFPQPLGARTAVAVDGSVVLIGTLCGGTPDMDDIATCRPGTYAGAVFDESERAWRALTLPNSMARAPVSGIVGVGATSDGRAVFAVGNDAHSGVETAVAEFWTYRVAGDAWEQIPGPGATAVRVCMAQDELVVFTPTYLPSGAGFDASIAVRNLVQDPDWQRGSSRVIDPPMDDGSFGLFCVGGRAAVVSTIDSLGTTFLYDPTTDTWAAAPAAPVQQFVGWRIPAGSRLLYLAAEPVAGVNLALDATTGVWSTLDGLPRGIENGIWNGDAVVGYAGPPRRGAAGDPLTADALQPTGVFRYVPTG
ncbi:MAG: hypothetical protein WDA60_03170 [Acidimicrobiia bacterium]|jgi:hypothetical protein